MDKILEYVLANNTWILGGIIVILLAVIGSYADKTNFGQGELKDQKDENAENNDLLEGQLTDDGKAANNVDGLPTRETLEKDIDSDKEFNEKFEKMSQEVEDFLPEKDLIDGELLDEIENLSLDKTQKINVHDIPDLDDVELPKIKNLKSTDDDIWKF